MCAFGKKLMSIKIAIFYFFLTSLWQAESKLLLNWFGRTLPHLKNLITTRLSALLFVLI